MKPKKGANILKMADNRSAIIENDLLRARNMGVAIYRRLNEIGVYCLKDLADLTPAKAYLKICEKNPQKKFPICYYLYSLQGALLNIYWNDLPEDCKRDLLRKIGR